MLCVYLPMTAQLTAEQQNHRTFIRHDGATARAVVAAQQLRAAVVRLRARQHALPARGGGGRRRRLRLQGGRRPLRRRRLHRRHHSHRLR